MNLRNLLQRTFLDALTGLVADPTKPASLIKPTSDAKHGHYQANCAMSLAKELRKKPRDIAEEIVARLDLGDWLEKPEVAGPGFINLRIRSDWLAKQIRTVAQDERLGVTPAAETKTYVIDFSGPNVAKPMHVGHLRSTILGDAIARILRFLGHNVITDNHLGDWGTQFGILIYGYKNHLDPEEFARNPVQELARLYVLVRSLMAKTETEDGETEVDPNDQIMAACREETAKLHVGDEENNRLWREFMPHCYQELDAIYRRLGVVFDHTLGESFYHPRLGEVVSELREKGIAVESRGAIAIFVEEERPPALIQKTDGAYTYTTTDLATIRHRMKEWNPDTLLYVVDFRQKDHFGYLFKIAKKWGYEEVQCEHISFGSVLGPDGRPFSTRAGGASSLEALLDKGVAEAAKTYYLLVEESRERGEEVPKLSPEEEQRIAEVVGIGAIKYADLCQNRNSDYVFSYEKMLAMNGNTATYMQYAYARTRSILRRGKEAVARYREDPPEVLLDHPAEQALALQILRYEEDLTHAGSEWKPNLVTSYLWDLCKSFNTFFNDCPVLKAETPELRESRLLLCDLTGRVIQKSLALLGIDTIERM